MTHPFEPDPYGTPPTDNPPRILMTRVPERQIGWHGNREWKKHSSIGSARSSLIRAKDHHWHTPHPRGPQFFFRDDEPCQDICGEIWEYVDGAWALIQDHDLTHLWGELRMGGRIPSNIAYRAALAFYERPKAAETWKMLAKEMSPTKAIETALALEADE